MGEHSKARAHLIQWVCLGSALSRAKVEDDVPERLTDELATMAMHGDAGIPGSAT